MALNYCRCPEPRRNTLPKDLITSASLGEVNDIRAWLHKGGDINAADEEGNTILSTAANHGQVGVINELFTFPNIHLNTVHSYSNGQTQEGDNVNTSGMPLWIAAANGHLACVNALLRCNLSCSLDKISKKGGKLSAIMVAAEKRNWDIVNALAASRSLNCREASHIFSKATKHQEWGVVLNVVSNCRPLHADLLHPLIDSACEDGEWHLIREVLQKDFRYKSECLNRALLKSTEEKNWERVTELLKMMSYPKPYNMDLVNAALSEDCEGIKALLDKNNYDDDTANASLVVIAAGGTSDKIASMLIKKRYYSKNSQRDVLLLSALNGNLEFMQEMFAVKTRNKFTYQALSRGQKVAADAGHLHVEMLLKKILEKETENIVYNY